MSKKFMELNTTHHATEFWSRENRHWDLSLHNGYWVGGYFQVPNLSSGYHGILKQWWDFYRKDKPSDVLLVSEGNNAKSAFQQHYENWRFKTTDKYFELQSEPDIIADICEANSLPENSFDLVITQATLEHLYDPWTAIKNCLSALRSGGILVIHTHPPGFVYHSFPRDYFRFMKDFWYDIPYWLDNVELLEFYMHSNSQVFACYKKL